MTSHHCHALNCKAPCPPRMLMCGPCWAVVPRGLQALVYRHFNPAQCRGADRPSPSGPWMIAADCAILANALVRSPPKSIEDAKRIRMKLDHKLRLAIEFGIDTTPAPEVRAVLDAAAKAIDPSKAKVRTWDLLHDALQAAMGALP